MSAYERTSYTRIETPPELKSTAMGSMFRSEEMVLCQLFLQPEAAYSTISELGEAGIVQFRDLNGKVNLFQRKFATEVIRCDEMERQLRYIETEINKDEIKVPELDEQPRAPFPREMINLEAHLEKTENDIMELSQNGRNLKSSYLELSEMQYVLERSQLFFTEQGTSGRQRESVARVIIEEDRHVNRGRLCFVAGVVERERVPAFERMLWRISRGNVFLRQSPLDEPFVDPITNNEVYKTVFVAFFQGEQLKSRVLKVCTGFRASLYPVPETDTERAQMLEEIKTRVNDLQIVLNQTQDHRNRVLVSVANQLQNWKVMVHKMKAIYHTLNMFTDDVTKKCLIGECWVPTNDLSLVQEALKRGSSSSGSTIQSFLNVIDTDDIPPTYNRTNRFTRGFQNLIDSYGIATYREANPALYTIITFPFLFAVMFGDFGHGTIMFLFALYMVVRENYHLKHKSNDEIWNIFFGGRYIILLMGLFSMYTGLIYNDVFSKSFNIYKTSWRNYLNLTEIINTPGSIRIVPDDGYKGYPFPFGIDPAWQLAENKIMFLNSFKMKLSIIIAIVHMLFGVCVGVFNHVYFKHYSAIFLEFIPRVVFLTCLIFYLVFMIFYKWFVYYAGNEDFLYSAYCAPSILIIFINMMLQKAPDHVPNCNDYMFSGQDKLHTVIVLLALICVPILLCGHPLTVMISRKNKAKKTRENGIELTSAALNGTPAHSSAVNDGEDEENPEEEMSEIWITSGIHTIEFCLNTISHTASYLRLWALSLAHAQLSDVLWTMVFRIGFNHPVGTGAIFTFVIFAIWASFTVAILVLMEGLSAFLHTLRLHWVEFMSKFYEGNGYAFEPFSFATLVEGEEE